MQKVISASEMRQIDRLTTERFSTLSILLMEAAGAAAMASIAATLDRDPKGLRVLILCGRGNNGGDGAALARALYRSRAIIDVVLLGRIEDTKGDARMNFDIARSLDVSSSDQRHRDGQSPSDCASSTGAMRFNQCPSIQDFDDAFGRNALEGYDIIVDALFGTGLTRPLEGLEEKVVLALRGLRASHGNDNNRRPIIVSLDIPSGLNADSALLIGTAVQADLTVTLTAPKLANVLPPASDLSGKLVVADIGSPQSLVDDSASKLFVSELDDARQWLVRTRYTRDSYKNSHGHALVVAGSPGFAGAAVLCSEAAMRAGAGLVTIATPLAVHSAISSHVMPEVMVSALPETESGSVSLSGMERVKKLAEKASVIAIGPGLSSENEETRRFVRAVVEERGMPVVIDADGLNSLSPWPADLRGSGKHPLVLTPHVGEMLRLLDAEDKNILKGNVDAARNFAVDQSVILVLKGSRTLIAAPDGRVFINPTGNPGLGTAGSGDTLTGIITGFLAQEFASFGNKADALSACLAAVYVGGMAGDLAASELGMRAMVASDVRSHLSAAICRIDAPGELL